MSRANILSALQGLGITLNLINIGLAVVTKDAVVVLIFGAIVGGYQYFIQHLGNTTPTTGEVAKQL